MILVYEYMPNGSLHYHLHNKGIFLSWVTRLKIAIGVARGLEYLDLHGVIHGNVKSSNILLDKSYEAVISGFGLSVINPTIEDVVEDKVKGTPGYVDPEYLASRRLTWKTDVYSFGVVLFELLSGMRAGSHGNLVEWAQKCEEERKLSQLIDFSFQGVISTEHLHRFMDIAKQCVHKSSEFRPTMTEVAASLEALLEPHQKQEKPNRSAKSSGKIGFGRKVYNYFVRAKRRNQSCCKTSLGCTGEDCRRSCLCYYCFLPKATTKRKQD